MTVAVNKGYVVAQHLAAPDDLVDVGGAIEHIKSYVRPKDSGGIFFRIANRAVVVKQGAKLGHGNGKVGAKDVFAKKLVHGHPCGAFEKTLAAHVAGRVPCVFVFIGVAGHAAEKGRIHRLQVIADQDLDAPCQKIHGICYLPDAVVYFGKDIRGQILQLGMVSEQHNRDGFIALTDALKQLCCRCLLAGVLTLYVPVYYDSSKVCAGCKNIYCVFISQGYENRAAFVFHKLLLQLAQSATFICCRIKFTRNNQYRPFMLVYGHWRAPYHYSGK